jgi:hypothetical protein
MIILRVTTGAQRRDAADAWKRSAKTWRRRRPGESYGAVAWFEKPVDGGVSVTRFAPRPTLSKRSSSIEARCSEPELYWPRHAATLNSDDDAFMAQRNY